MSQKKDDRSPQQRAADHLKKVLRKAAMGGAALGMTTGLASCWLAGDPPAPPFCENSPSSPRFTLLFGIDASWRQSDAGQSLVHVEVAFRNGNGEVVFHSDPTLAGATLVSIQREEQAVRFDFVPEAGKVAVDVVIPLTCDSKVESMKLRFDVSQPSGSVPHSILE
ncbi:MAG: hypothetical protein QM765_32975 [Myxococcales bacterium]